MNFIGKTCVLLFGAISIFCLVTGMAVYTQRLDLVAPKSDGAKKTVTLVDQSIERTKDLSKANNRAYSRWMQEYEEVAKLEVEQFQRREFYRGQMELVRTGLFAGEKELRPDSIQELPKRDDVTKLLVIDMPTGRPPVKVTIQKNMESAKPYGDYLNRIREANKEYGMIQKDIHDVDAEKKDIGLEAEIAKTTAEIKALRPRIDQQEDIARDAILERDYLEDFITNRRADAQLFVKRRDALKASIERLKVFNQKRQGGQGN